MLRNLGQAKIGLLLVVIVFVSLIIFSLTRKINKNSSQNSFTGVSNTSTNSALPNSGNGDIKSDRLANNYFVFTEEAYETTKTYKQPVFLFFYSSSCPTCAKQDAIVVETFNNLGKNNVIGFRVNYNDSDTSQAEKDLAKKFEVSDRLTMFILDKDSLEAETFLGETDLATLTTALNKVNTIR